MLDRLPARGGIRQLAFVPDDPDAVLKFWIESMGVGPFYMLEHLPYEDVLYRGKPIHLDVSVALAYWGDIQIEIVIQHNDVVSGYTESTKVLRNGLHHVLVESDDVDTLHAAWLARGATELMTGSVPGSGRFIYLDIGGGGPHVELVHLTSAVYRLFDYIRGQAQFWDGSDPIRAIPDESAW